MSNPPVLRAGLRLFRAACVPAALLLVSVTSIHAQPGLDAPEAIGPYLGGKFPAVESTAAGEWTVNETYQGININLPTHLMPYPGTNKLLCVAKEGRIFLFEDTPSASATSVFLDWRANTFTSSDCGMDWLVFHPEFGQAGSPNRGYVYITYKWAPAGGNGNEAFWRLSRFTVPDGTQAADPASEQILIQQYDRQQFHDSGCMIFGPDGYLYYAIGDEGGANDQYNVGQRINERLFSGIMRIDVDQKAGSHAIRRQPAQIAMPAGWPDSFTANYTIPDDNPFVDAGGGNLEEFYAIGFRQPYRFSYDPETQRTWVGESGQDTQEEISILSPGANYGWPFREGSGPGPQAQPAVVHGTLTEPVWSVAHAAGPDGCVVGGFVYRGAAHPSLTGKFITVDNVSGRIRSFDYANGVATGTILTDMPSGSVYSGTSTIGRDQAGEPVFIKISGTTTRGRFMKLAIEPPAAANPVWYRFEDQAASNSSGYVSDNPGNKTGDSISNGLGLVVNDDESTSGANVAYSSTSGSGLVPAGTSGNATSIRTISSGDADGYPGNAAGSLILEDKFGRLDDFTIELSLRPSGSSLTTNSYQCFLGLDGTSGTTPIDTENGPPIQPFRLMRWGRNGAGNSLVALAEGDLFLDIRTINPANGQWNSVPVKLLTKANFPASQWYHLAIVGKVSTGTVTVYSYANGSYTQIGQQTGYFGNIPSGYWTVGRGMHNGNPTDYTRDARFDEIRIANTALAPAQFLYAGQPWQPTIVVTQPPALLSQTGAFSELATLTPAQGVFPYGVNAPLWSDAALKKRWIALPNDGTHNTPEEKIGFSSEGSWSFPAGTVFIKHFELATDENNPAIHRRLETRFIVMSASGEPYGVTYRWLPDGSDAELLPGGFSDQVTIHEAGGGTHIQTWDYPSRTDCRICHNGNAGHILGLKTWQLNGDLGYDRTGRSANQLETMGALGWFDSAYNPAQLPWFLKSHNISDTSASLEERVRSYIDSNCSQCHRPGGVRAFFDARLSTPLAEQGLIRGELEVPYFDPGDRVIVPGDLARSILKVRHGTAGTLKMPPIAKNLVDEQAAQVIGDWILSLPPAPAVHLAAPSGAGGAFEVTVHFSEPVSGLVAADFSVLNGSVTSLTGSGADYIATLTPHHFGEVVVSLPAGKAQAAGGQGNFASGETHTIISDVSLLAWLKLDDGSGGTASDSSPAEHSGTLLGMEPTDWIGGKFGGALAFDGSGELVSMSNVASGDFTISFWMRSTQAFQGTNAPPSGRAIVTADAPGPSNDFMIAGTRGSNGQGGLVDRISFQTGFAGGALPNAVIHGTSAVSTGNWVHVAATRVRATGEMKLYVNGVLEASGTGSTDLLNANPVLGFGGNPAGAANSYQGDLDQFRIHGRALSASEIAELAQETGALPPYQQWLAIRLPGLTHLHGLDLDPEADGNSNFAEFAFGGSPTAYDRFLVPANRAADGSVTLSYLVRKAPAGAIYHVIAGGDLNSWTNISPDLGNIQHQDIPGTDYERITATYVPPPDSPQLFFRIEALPE